MPTELRLALICGIFFYFALLLYQIKKRNLYLKYILLWIISGILMLALALFPESLKWVANVTGIVTPVNALFVIALFCIIIILMSITAIVSKLNDKVKILIQEHAILQKDVCDLREELFKLKEEKKEIYK